MYFLDLVSGPLHHQFMLDFFYLAVAHNVLTDNYSTVFDHACFFFFSFLHAERQYISDVLCLAEHGDPQIRGATAILCGAIIQAALTKTRYNIHTWLASVQSATG